MTDNTEYDSKLDYSNQTNAERFAKLNGIKPIMGAYTAGAYQYDYPDFDAKSILEVMLKRDDWDYFIQVISGRVTSLGWHYWVLNPDKLLDEAVKWLAVKHES
jgi:hypothetical protein